MRIIPPYLIVGDLGLWAYRLNIQELIDGGITSIVLGFYKQWDYLRRKYVLNSNCRRMADQIAASPLTMQSYYYYYVTRDPIGEADWFVEAMRGYPVKFAWSDCEDKCLGASSIFRSEQNRRFTAHLYEMFPSGLYTAKWYVDGYAPDMVKWIGKYQAWIAHYGRQPYQKTAMTWQTLKTYWMPNYDILLPGGLPQANVVGHQFAETCILPAAYTQYGVRMPFDVSVFSKYFMDTIQGNPPPPPVPAPNTWRVTAINGINVRSSAHSIPDDNKIGILPVGAEVIVDTAIGQWLHFTARPDFPSGGWVYQPYMLKLS